MAKLLDFDNIHCPQCGAVIRTENEDAQTVIYQCEKCDWWQEGQQ